MARRQHRDSILVIGDPILARAAAAVRDVDAHVAALCATMSKTLDRCEAVGLAAPQIGVARRVFVWNGGLGERFAINPRIADSHGECTMIEACLSIPGAVIEVTRPEQVYLIALGRDGEEIAVEADGIEARVIQHEIDHLDGVLMLDRLDPDSRAEALAALNHAAP